MTAKKKLTYAFFPTGAKTVRFAPYPFDVAPLNVGSRARLLTAGKFASEAEALAAYHKAPRQLLVFEIVE